MPVEAAVAMPLVGTARKRAIASRASGRHTVADDRAEERAAEACLEGPECPHPESNNTAAQRPKDAVPKVPGNRGDRPDRIARHGMRSFNGGEWLIFASSSGKPNDALSLPRGTGGRAPELRDECNATLASVGGHAANPHLLIWGWGSMSEFVPTQRCSRRTGWLGSADPHAGALHSGLRERRRRAL